MGSLYVKNPLHYRRSILTKQNAQSQKENESCSQGPNLVCSIDSQVSTLEGAQPSSRNDPQQWKKIWAAQKIALTIRKQIVDAQWTKHSQSACVSTPQHHLQSNIQLLPGDTMPMAGHLSANLCTSQESLNDDMHTTSSLIFILQYSSHLFLQSAFRWGRPLLFVV